MGQLVLILGPSGSGKSTSMRNFAHDEVALINVNKKPLPFRGKFDSTLATADYAQVEKAVQVTKKKSIIIDDAGYLITHQFMEGHRNNKGNAVFELYNDLADNFYRLIKFCQTRLPDGKIVYFMMHVDKNDFGESKPKTIGRLLDEKVCVEGLFTIVLTTECKDGEYIFRTKTNGLDVTKSPLGMFESAEIPNDLKAVDSTIREFYELEPLTTTAVEEKKGKEN